VLAFLWQPRQFAGLFIGTSFAPLLIGAFGKDKSFADDSVKVAFTSLLVGLVIYEVIPLFDEIAKPTRAIRLTLVVLLVLIALIRSIAYLVSQPKEAKA
jgi:hypothetical protein